MKCYLEKCKRPNDVATSALHRGQAAGQALIEYALILVLVGFAFVVAFEFTQPTISEAFNRTLYSIMGEEPEVREGGSGPGDFWLTVTWVALNPPDERDIPARTLAPPSATPTPGPSPTPRPIIPTNTPVPTNTPTPTPTPTDLIHIAPWLDTADNPNWYRGITDDFPLGSADWVGEYYVGMNLDSGGAEPLRTERNRNVYGGLANRILDFPNPEYQAWTSDMLGPFTNWPTDNPYDRFSIRFRRDVFIQPVAGQEWNENADRSLYDLIPLQFSVRADDGVRVWLLPSVGPPEDNTYVSASDCYSVANGGDGTVSGGPSLGSNRTFDSGCLVIDDWVNGDRSISAFREVVPGRYRIQVDYYEDGGRARLNFNVGSSANWDDGRITGDPRGDFSIVNNLAQCNWGVRETEDSNSLERLWDQYVGGTIDTNTICFLELRGMVVIPDETMPQHDPIVSPRFVFWDVWDLGGPQAAWLEIGEYQRDPDQPLLALDRDAMEWNRVPLHAGATMNYNWTRHDLDLSNLEVITPDGNTETIDFRGREVTFRFAFANGAGTQTRRWYIDDIQIIEGLIPSQYVQDIGLDVDFDLNSADDENYFRTSGQWALTGNNTAPSEVDGSFGCCSWELRPDGTHTRLSVSPWDPVPSGNTVNYEQVRIHYVELLPTIDTTISVIDQDGDMGDPVLSFWHGYDIDAYVGLEVQYRAEGSDEWRVIPGPGVEAFGRIISPSNTNRTENRNFRTLQPVDIPLRYIVTPSGDPITRFNIRFTMLVHARATEPGQGWWIDNIKLHREDRERFLDYPLIDGAEDDMSNWLATGTWWRTTEEAFEGNHSFADSPGGNYFPVSGSPTSGNHLRTIYPIDLNNDTPANLASFENNEIDGGNTQQAISPYLTFWHKRELGSSDHLYVEWRRASEGEGDWKPLWTYRNGMRYVPNNTQARTRNNRAWEFVEVSLQPLMDQIIKPGDPGYDPTNEDIYRNDDVYFRFRLESNNFDVSRGWFIDNIRLEEYSEQSYRLWQNNAPGVIGGTDYGLGSGLTLITSPDEPDWFTKWRAGGDWSRVNWASRTGLYSFHESGSEQDAVPYWRDDPVTNTRARTYNVLESTRIIDMRATDRAISPTLYFWSRFRTGEGDSMRVQISYELRPGDYGGTLLNHMRSRCGNNAPQCYEQIWGWSAWTDLPLTNGWNTGQSRETFSWQRWQADLSQVGSVELAANPDQNRAGRRVRLRFLFDAQDGTQDQKRDGWYIDRISIEPLRNGVIANISNTVFFDDASSLTNWIPEGLWGLDPAVSISATGGAASIGVWQEFWWDANDCTGNFRNCVNTRFNNNSFTVPPLTRNVLEINYDMGNGGPRPNFVNSSGNPIVDRFAGRWVMNTLPIGDASGILPGTYTFITTTDDGVRMRWQEIDAAGNVIDNVAGTWNIINNFTDHGRTVDIGTAQLDEGKRYRLTLEYYENGGGAVMILAVGGTNFSFTDSPRQSADLSFPDTPPLPFSNSSLLLDGTLDLRNAVRPVMEYYTTYKLECSTRLFTEFSNDGGFTWGRSGLANNMQIAPGVTDSGFTNGDLAGTRLPDSNQGWREIRHNLTNYEGQQIMIRFRLDRQGRGQMRHGECSGQSAKNWYIGVWIADIIVARTG